MFEFILHLGRPRICCKSWSHEDRDVRAAVEGLRGQLRAYYLP